MRNVYKKILISALVISMMLPFSSIVAMSENDDTLETEQVDTTDTTDTEEDVEEDEVIEVFTDEQVLAAMELKAENDNLELYLFEGNSDIISLETDLIALRNKATGYIWWSSPINADSDPYGKPAAINALKSAIVYKYGTPSIRQESTSNYSYTLSTKTKKTTYKDIKNGFTITYKFTKQGGFEIPITYVLYDDHMSVSCVTANIVEADISTATGKLLTSLQLAPQFGSAGEDESGYFVVPDGSGAIINFNNGKTGYSDYTAEIYGRDLTPVPLTAPAVTEQAYLPVYGIVKGDNALVCIADKGDSNASIKANVSGKVNAYNACSFEFKLRSSDKYYMSGEANPLLVFQKGEIKIPEVSVSYYPISGDALDYVDVATTYREYLIKNENLVKKTQANNSPFYLDLFGGVIKQQSILGIPFNLKTSITSFSEAQTIVDSLSTQGIDNIVLNYNDWTNNSIKNKISTDVKPSGTLGGKSEFNDMLDHFSDENVEFYPALDNVSFLKSGNGFLTWTNTAIRVSNAYSRQVDYDIPYEVPIAGRKAAALLSPQSYNKVIDKIIKSFGKNDMNSISLGGFSDTLVSDFSKKNGLTREETMNLLVENYKAITKDVGTLLADSANAYVFPYATHITNVPLSSSQYDITDYDIPFYGMVLHGYIPLSSNAINGSADSEKLFLLALASGISIHYDMIYESSDEVKDTNYDDYYYANYKGWINSAAGEYKLANEVIKSVSDQTITGYEYITKDEIKTTYSNGTVTTVNITTGKITVNGVQYSLSDYVAEGGLVK